MTTGNPLEPLTRKLMRSQVGLLCGAGISIPAGLPSALGLASRICELICPREDHRWLLIDEVCKRHQIPFEAFIEIIIRVSGDSSFLDMFSEGEPAPAHLLAAHMAAGGFIQTIVTTNFDVLFERAIEATVTDSHACQVLSTDRDFDELTPASLKRAGASLLKVHGSYGDGPSGMLTTLHQLGQRRLVQQRMKAIDYLFRDGPHEVVLILGYSCSDVFDINERIQLLGTSITKTVFLLLHNEAAEPEVSRLNNFVEYPMFRGCGDESCVIRIDTNVFLKGVLTEIGVASSIGREYRDLWSPHVSHWFSKIDASVADRIVAAIFRRCGQYDAAAAHYSAAIETLTRLSRTETVADVLTQLGALHQLQGQYSVATEIYERALVLLNTGPSRLRSTALYQIGRVNEEIGDYDAALSKYEESMAIDQAIGDRAGVATCLHQTGIIYQEFAHDTEEAERRYRSSLQIKWELGDLEGVFNTLHQLSVLELIRDQHEAALASNDEALSLAQRLGLKHSIAYAHSHRGYILQVMGRLDEAETECRQALRVREYLDDPKGISRCYHRLGEIERLRGHVRLALRWMVRAYRLKVSIGDRFGSAEDALQIAAFAELAGHPIWGRKCREVARNAFTQLGCHKEAEGCGVT